jgi:hypothetical protein
MGAAEMQHNKKNDSNTKGDFIESNRIEYLAYSRDP